MLVLDNIGIGIVNVGLELVVKVSEKVSIVLRWMIRVLALIEVECVVVEVVIIDVVVGFVIVEVVINVVVVGFDMVAIVEVVFTNLMVVKTEVITEV